MRLPLLMKTRAVRLMIWLVGSRNGILGVIRSLVASMMVMVWFKFVGVAAVLPPNLGSEVPAESTLISPVTVN